MRIHIGMLAVVAAAGLAASAQAQTVNPWSLSVFTGGNVGSANTAFSGSATGAVYTRGSMYGGTFNVGGGVRASSDVVFSGILTGGIRAGHDVMLKGGTVNGGIVAGGSLKSTTGTTTVNGGATLAGTNQAGSRVAVNGGVSTGVSYTSTTDFVAMDNAYHAASSLAASLSPTGVALLSGNTMTLTASSNGTNVFNVTAAQIASSQNFVINAFAGSTVLINVSGDSIAFSGTNWSFLNGASAGKTLINAAGAWDVTTSGTLSATLLAPDALVRMTNASVHGSVMALGLQGSACFDGGFTGVIPAPGAWAIMGCCGVFAMRRRR